jgi:hypothetical protein
MYYLITGYKNSNSPSHNSLCSSQLEGKAGNLVRHRGSSQRVKHLKLKHWSVPPSQLNSHKDWPNALWED